MANPGGVGTKFVSVNLNKSYGQPSHHHRPSYSSSYGQAAASRGRPSSPGGGMVVLSRPRSSQKVGPKLSVPSPLNLPSLRKEHEKFDLLGSGGGSAGGAASGNGSRPSSSGMGWTKPGSITLQEDGSGDAFGRSGIDAQDGIDQSLQAVNSVTRGNSVYMPPSAQLGGIGVPVSASGRAYPSPAEKATVLSGEDFPSLQAALPTASGPVQKQKDRLHQKLVVSEESYIEQRDSSHSSSKFHMRPQGQALNHPFRNGLNKNAGESHGFGSSHMTEQSRKQEEYFPGPLPLVRLNPRSDWADDERDTGHGFADRSREHGFLKSVAYWDREFDLPKSSVLPHKPPLPFDRWSQCDDEAGKVFSREVPKLDPYRRDVRMPSREGNSWKSFPSAGDGFSTQEVVNDKNGLGARPTGLNRETGGENKYVPAPFGGNVLDAGLTGNQNSAHGRRDMGYGQGGRQQPSHTLESLSSRGAEWNTQNRYGSEQPNRFRGGSFQNNSASRSSFSSGGKGLPMNPMLNFGKEKRAFARNDRPYSEDPFLKDMGGTGFDEGVPFSGGLLGVIKRKKDVVKQADLHDPVRESFEAELEREQKMQEQERQRIIEEQEKALEQARREDEERQQLIREEEERRRRLEEEAREAAWRVEQGRLEATQKAEEQRIAREEEKQRLFMEEERRKQAAKQKLLELEARIAKRQAEEAKGDSSASVADEKVSDMLKENDISGAVDVDNWEDSERTVERITISTSYYSLGPAGPFEISSRPHPTRDGSSGSLDRGKHVISCRRDVFETGKSSPFLIQDQDNAYVSPRQDVSISGRLFPRKEFYEGSGCTSSRTYFEGGMQEPHIDDFTHPKGHRWNASGGGHPYGRNTEIDSEFHENLSENNDVGGHSRSNARSPYPEQLYPSSEGDELYSYGRSRYSMRQPRVLPPPSLASMHKTSFRGDNERPGPSTFFGNNMQYNHKARSESTMKTGFYGDHPETLKPFEMVDVRQETTIAEPQKLDKDTAVRCDSQSSLSVSSPPNSPNPLSHDDLDEIGSAAAERKEIPLCKDESVVLNAKSGKDTLMIASSSISAGDDEEWAIENNGELQEQEEYDEDGDGYQEEDEVHEGDYENPDLTQEFKDMHLVKKGTSNMMDNLVLGFDEGHEVGIPSDEFESNSRNEENTLGVPKVSVGIEEQVPVYGMAGDGQSLQAANDSPQVSIDGSSTRIQDSAVQTIANTPQTSLAYDLLDRVGGSSSSGLSSQHALPSPVHMASHSSSSQSVMSTLPASPSKADLPVKLQFGMFSGPSLISASVPAIQIGSIQMPLHLHPPVGSSLSHMHPSQPSLFQFGQLRYTSPISQGILPMAPQSMSFVQPNAQAHYNMSQKSGVPLPIQPIQDNSTHNMMKVDMQSDTAGDQQVLVSRTLNLSHENASRGLISIQVRDSAESTAMIDKTRAGIPRAGENKVRSEPGFITEDKGDHQTGVNNYKQSSNERGSEGQSQTGQISSQSVSSRKDSSRSKAQGPLSDVKGKTFTNSFKNFGPRSSFQVSEASRTDSSVFQKRPQRTIQRTEFCVRENVDRRQSSGLVSSENLGLNDKSNLNGRGVGFFVRSGSKKFVVSSKPLKQIAESECSSSGAMISQEISSGSRANKGVGKEALTENQSISRAREGNLKRNSCPEECVDAPLESGVVHIFKQAGIEVPSDEDDFVQVRSKRQVLNDRREQREKEIKEKSRVTKTPRRPRYTKQSTAVSTHSNKISASFAGEAPHSIHPDFVVSEQGLANVEVSTGFTSIVSQPLSAIGTPAGSTDAQADRKSNTIKSLPSSSISSISNGGKSLGPDLIFETENKVLGNFRTSLGSWGNERINQQVMALTQTQLDEAMKPVQFDAHVASIGDHTSSVSEPIMPSSSILMKDKSFSTTASPIDSLLAGEKIQFGAVTSPTVLHPCSRVVSHGIGPPGSGRLDIQITRDLSAAENDCTLFFGKDKHSNESCVHIEDREASAEAEAAAAASAVAAAAISCDESIGNESSVSVSDTKSCGGADIVGITGGGVACDQLLPSQPRAEESLSVALPADLSVETSAISLWPTLPSPQNSLSRMLSHFPGGPHSHYPIFDMNPMLGGPFFACSPRDESTCSQSQSQKSTASVSGHLGTWQQGHSGVDSFYGPPAGFTGPFISPPGGIPGVQAPPHMVVYNHFAPVGQFGQVGLSFLGTTYIPSGKQPDWKHNVSSSAMGIGEGDVHKMNMVSAQCDTSNMPAPVPHLAPGSSLLPMASPLAMFDLSPFQSAPDMSAQGRWSHVPASPLHSIPVSLPSQQQAEGVLPSQFSHGYPVDQLLTANRFLDSRTTTPSDSNQSFPVATDATVTQFPDGLGIDSLSSATAVSSTHSAINKGSSSGSTKADVGKPGAGQNCSSNNGKGHSTNDFRTQSSQQKNPASQQYSHYAGYNYQRGGGGSQKNNLAGEWSQRRLGFHGRNQSVGPDKNFPASKMKQIYVAKQTTSGTSTVG